MSGSEETASPLGMEEDDTANVAGTLKIENNQWVRVQGLDSKNRTQNDLWSDIPIREFW